MVTNVRKLWNPAGWLAWLKKSWHEPHLLYVAVALVWGIVQLSVLPPYIVPDENTHYHRAWGVAQGQIVCGPDSVVGLPENVGQFFNTLEVHIGFPGAYTFSDAAAFAHEPISDKRVDVYTPACAYNPLSYLPAAAAIDVVRVLHLSPFHAFYAARLATLLVAIALTAWAIKRTPFGKWLLLLVALLPMTVQQYAGVTADALTIAGLILFVALTLDYSQRSSLGRRQLAVLLAAAVLLVPLKPIYLPVLALVLLLRPRQFGGWKRYVGFLAVYGLLGVGVAFALLRLFSGAVPLQPSALIDPAAQLGTLQDNPVAVVRFLHEDLVTSGITYVQGLVALPGWLHFTYGGGFYLLVALGFLGVLTSAREDVRLTGWQRLLLLGISYVSVVGLALFLFVMWTPPGATRLEGIQGRYFLPIVPLVLLAVTSIKLTKVTRAVLVVSLVATIGLLATGALRSFYYLEPYQSTVPAHSSSESNDFERVRLVNVTRSSDRFTATNDDPQLIVDVRDLVGLSIEIDGTGPWELRYRYAGNQAFDEQRVDRIPLPATLPNHSFTPRHIDLDLLQLEVLTSRDVIEVRIDPTDHAENFRVSQFSTYLP